LNNTELTINIGELRATMKHLTNLPKLGPSIACACLLLAAFGAAQNTSSRATRQPYDVLIRNGHIIDGTGNPWFAADVAIEGDRVVAIGRLEGATAKRVIDASGLIVAPGFIDMLGQSEGALLIDNRALSKLSQGITTEITGEGESIAPQNDLTLAHIKPLLDQYHLTVDWTDLHGYFRRLVKAGTPLNLGTYVGAAQVREAVLGEADRAPTADELVRMKALVAETMRQGAFGISTALIYPPGHYAKTEELIELAKVASQYGGLYASHLRSEGQSQMEALDEAIRIGREAHLPVEVFHLKVSGKSRWGNMPKVVTKIQAARSSGLDIAANMYPYTAGGTDLIYSLPPWAADGGLEKALQRLHDPAMRQRIAAEMAVPHADWENLYLDCGGGRGVLISSVVNPDLKKYAGMNVAEMAKAEGKPEMDALFDFILADEGATEALYFMASEEDLQAGLQQPWTSIGLDAEESSLDGPLFEPHAHPRGWGSMPRFLGHYARDLRLVDLPQAIRKITSLPAQREHLKERGLLQPGFYADITIFNPETVIDAATFADPNRVSKGVEYVFVNGQLEYENGKLTGATAGRPLYGPGYVAEDASPRTQGRVQ
jgi:N-acyl-D-amino-acid deacylase